MTAASRLRGAAPDDEVIVLEAGRFTSYSACGIPFVVGGVVTGGVEALVARSPDEHRRRGIDVRIHHEAVAIDTSAGVVEVLDEEPGRPNRLGYDQLLVATGGAPIRPDLPGIDLPFVRGVQTLEDAEVLLSLAEQGCRRVVVVGGGYIGLELAESFIERGCTATIVERQAQPLGVLDADFGQRVAAALEAHGIDVRVKRRRRGFRAGQGADVRRADRGRPRGARHRGASALGAGRGRRHRARRCRRDPRRRPPGHVRRRCLVGGGLRRVDPPGHRPAGVHRARHVRQPPRPCGRSEHGRR